MLLLTVYQSYALEFLLATICALRVVTWCLQGCENGIEYTSCQLQWVTTESNVHELINR